jgi:hypothetical protein
MARAGGGGGSAEPRQRREEQKHGGERGRGEHEQTFVFLDGEEATRRADILDGRGMDCTYGSGESASVHRDILRRALSDHLSVCLVKVYDCFFGSLSRYMTASSEVP